jgi:hypothetical protein
MQNEAQRQTEFILGLDLGQAQDFTALTIVERITEPLNEWDSKTHEQKTGLFYHIRHLERPALGTSYPAIVERVRTLMAAPELIQYRETRREGRRAVDVIRPALVVDATGVGRPVVDLFRTAKLRPIAVTIHGGEQQSQEGSFFRVPKRNLVSTLQIAFQNEHLKVAKSLPLAEVLVTELLNFRMKIDLKTAHDSYEAWREGQHDDLVLAVALALWWAEEKHKHWSGVIPITGN